MSLALIPKGVLEKVRKINFKFMWDGSQDHFVLPWVKWESLAAPKALGEWGLKNISLFSKVLVEKSIWRLVSSEIPMNEGSNSKIHSPGIGGGMDKKSTKIKALMLNHMEGDYQIFSCCWGRTSMENKKQNKGMY
jgi:hypothetical protein